MPDYNLKIPRLRNQQRRLIKELQDKAANRNAIRTVLGERMKLGHFPEGITFHVISNSDTMRVSIRKIEPKKLRSIDRVLYPYFDENSMEWNKYIAAFCNIIDRVIEKHFPPVEQDPYMEYIDALNGQSIIDSIELERSR